MKNRFLTIGVLAGVAAGIAVAAFAVAASGAIDATYRYAWNDVIGWFDFGNGTVTVTSTQLTGYTVDAPPGSQYGNVALDCATTPSGNVCNIPAGVGNWGVVNDGSGNLSGFAWSDAIGWISFCGGAGTANCPGGVTYQVKVDPASGDFSGFAWNDVVGWIGFNCHDSEGITCAHDYRVKTSWTAGPPPPNGSGPGGFDSNTWLISSILDTRVTGGAAFNTLSWQGSQPAGTRVGFQIAVSNSSSGPWTYLGPDDTANTVYEPAGVNVQLPLGQAAALRRNTNNNRYVRYKAWLLWSGSQGPRVDDVVISYSP